MFKQFFCGIAFVSCVLLSVAGAYGAPAYPYKIQVEDKNGRLVSIYLKGDELLHYGLSEDGYTLIQKANRWFYAERGMDGMIHPSLYELEAYDSESNALKLFKDSISPYQLPDQHKYNTLLRSKSRIVRSQVSHVGEKRALVILMQFRDTPMKFSKDDFAQLFNQVGYYEDGAKGSVRDYFHFASDGQLDYQTDLYGPYTTQYPMSYYGGNNQYGGDSNPQQMAVEAFRSLPEDVDLSIYDNDGDGRVDNVHIIYAGYGEEAGGNSNTIWAHEYSSELPVVVNGMRFSSYSCSPELRYNFGSKITRIGVICHELGHALGAMDYYDTNYSTGGSFDGTGVWDLMADGSWNDDGISPAKPNPYVCAYDYGWSPVVSPSESGTYTLDENTIIRLETGSPNDYYLLENRRRTDFDSELPAEGLLIYHHHPKCEDWAENFNKINQTHPQGFYPVFASSTKAIPTQARDYGAINSADCVFSMATRTSFSSSTTPAAFAWDGTNVPFSITNIRKVGDGTMSFDLVLDEEENGGVDDNEEIAGGCYRESFENGISDFTKNQLSGSVSWDTYPSSSFFTESSLIPESFEGDRLLLLFTGYKGRSTSSELKSLHLELSADSIYTFSCMYRNCYAPGSKPPQLSIRFVVNDNIVIDAITLKYSLSEWKRLEYELPPATSKLQFIFEGLVYTGGIFLDDVQLNGIAMPLSINNTHSTDDVRISVFDGSLIIETQSPTECSIYSVSGAAIQKNMRVAPGKHTLNLPHGVYVVRTEKGLGFKVAL